MSKITNGFKNNPLLLNVEVYWGYKTDPITPVSNDPKLPDLSGQSYWTFQAKDGKTAKKSRLILNQFEPNHNISIEYNSQTYEWKITAAANIQPGDATLAGVSSTNTTTNANVEIGPRG